MKVLKKEQIASRNLRVKTKGKLILFNFEAEREILEKIKNPFIVDLHYAFQTEDKLYFIMDFLNGGELFWHLRKDMKFSEKRARFYAAEIVCAIETLHANGIIYRDLKPENIILDSTGNLKITDFGLSKQGLGNDTQEANAKTYSFCGTPEYLAPEIITGQGHDKAVDWWSLGALIYEMLSGRPPHYSKNRKQMM
jgi:serine/threonine protein kinase